MTDYPKYIRDEVQRRLSFAFAKLAQTEFGQTIGFNPEQTSHVALADLLIESGFKPPVDPLLEQMWGIAHEHANHARGLNVGFEGFLRKLESAGLTVTVTKTGEA